MGIRIAVYVFAAADYCEEDVDQFLAGDVENEDSQQLLVAFRRHKNAYYCEKMKIETVTEYVASRLSHYFCVDLACMSVQLTYVILGFMLKVSGLCFVILVYVWCACTCMSKECAAGTGAWIRARHPVDTALLFQWRAVVELVLRPPLRAVLVGCERLEWGESGDAAQ